MKREEMALKLEELKLNYSSLFNENGIDQFIRSLLVRRPQSLEQATEFTREFSEISPAVKVGLNHFVLPKIFEIV